MKSNHGALVPPQHASARDEAAADARLGIAMRVVIGGAILFGAIALSMLLSSCGGSHEKTSGTSAGVAEAQPVQPASTSPTGETAAVASSDEDEEDPGDGLAPDLAVTSDTLAAPGSTIELIADATSDVAEVLVWDGLHDKQPFVYDVNGKVWRATYRIPMRPMSERLGLSVTARNTSNRWRRVWVFVTVRKEIESSQAPSSVESPATPDSEQLPSE